VCPCNLQHTCGVLQYNALQQHVIRQQVLLGGSSKQQHKGSVSVVQQHSFKKQQHSDFPEHPIQSKLGGNLLILRQPQEKHTVRKSSSIVSIR
jgi:hypothetical protein